MEDVCIMKNKIFYKIVSTVFIMGALLCTASVERRLCGHIQRGSFGFFCSVFAVRKWRATDYAGCKRYDNCI